METGMSTSYLPAYHPGGLSDGAGAMIVRCAVICIALAAVYISPWGRKRWP